MQAADIATCVLDFALASAQRRGIPVSGTVDGNRAIMHGRSMLTITALDDDAFTVAEDMGNKSGGVQTSVREPARWSASGPPYSWHEVQSIIERW
jgi:hypothetical protein